MKNCITIGGKIGYLREKTGRYEWAEIVGMDTENGILNMRKEVKQRKCRTWINSYDEKIDTIIKGLKTPSRDFPHMFLAKYKGTKKLY